MPRLRTGFSFRAAAGALDEVMSRIIECGYPVAPITDRASTFGFVKWAKLAGQNGLRPVFGVELAVAASYEEQKPTVDYWTFLAVDDLGSINRLVSLATEQFRYQPLLTYTQANAAKGVIKIVGHRAKFELVEPDPLTFYGLSPAGSRGHLRRAQEKGLELVATSENVFPREGDQGFYETLCGRGASTQTYDQFIQTDEQWRASVARLKLPEAELKAALDRRTAIWGQCRAELKAAELVKPFRPKPLREMCLDGAEKIGCDLTRPEYLERLDRELGLISEKNFEDYFYLVGDICKWARANMAVGPARGSSSGSLVCYLLEITTVDPIQHGLIFERFIDLNRADLPDIDIDFSDQQRYRVFEYIAKVYGEERVARLGTVSMFKARAALQEAGTALKVPRWKCEAVGAALVDRSSADSRATDSLEDALRGSKSGKEILTEWPEFIVAARMEGHPRHYSQHAAGVVVSAGPIEDIVAIDHRTGATMCDKKDAEGTLGLLKIDALGLTQLSVFEDALEMAKMTMDDLQRVPIDDPAAFDVLNRGEFSGIFQWNGGALQMLTRQITVDRFSDIVAISALARPGPLATGGSASWVKRRMSGGVATSLHPLLTELTKETYGVVVYQEQVMKVVREMGNLSWEDTSAIRKAMSATLGDEFFAQFKQKFVEGAGTNDVPPEIAAEIWDQINTFGSWAFNKSHAVAYGYISYWCCWMKAHFPFEFAAATLTHQTDPARQLQILREMKKEGYGYVPVDRDLSTDRWTAGWIDGEKTLVGPLSSVKGIGPKLVSGILSARANGRPMPKQAEKLLLNPATEIDTLFPIRDAIDRVMPDPSERNIFTKPTMIEDLTAYEDTQYLIIGTPTKINPRNENELQKIEARGGKKITDGPTDFLQLRIADDTGEIFCSVNRYNFAKFGQQIIDKGRPEKSLWALKGKVWTPGEDFTMFLVKSVRYIGDIDESFEAKQRVGEDESA
jgi:DNA polymerase III alpha subunit